VFTSALDPAFGDPKEYDIVATTFRLTEHFHYWTKHIAPNAALQPGFFSGDPEGLARGAEDRERGPASASRPARFVEGRALVTARIRGHEGHGKTVWHVGDPDPLRLLRPHRERARGPRPDGEPAHAERRRPELAHARVQDVPRQAREGGAA
jgi:hypothetical protein